MSRALDASELKVGMLVTVLERKGTHNRSGMGKVQTITAIDRPYLVTVEENDHGGTYTDTVDLRKVTLGTISRAYCRALNGDCCPAAHCHPSPSYCPRHPDGIRGVYPTCRLYCPCRATCPKGV